MPDASADSAAQNDAAQNDSTVADSSAMESSVDDAAAQDSATSTPDSAPDASATPDADASTDASAVDARSDASADAFVPPPGCMYTNVNDVVVECSGSYRFVSEFNVVPASRECPPYWQVGTSAPAATMEAAAANARCSTACVWNFSMSVSRIYCGVRSGYEVLSGTPNRCGQLYRFSEGYFASVAAHDAMFPCRDM